MPLAEVTAYTLSLWLHITAAVVGFGATFAESVTVPLALKIDQRHIPFVHRLGLVINRFFAVPALVIVLLTGFYQVTDDDYNWDMGDFWITGTLAIVAALAVINLAYFIPSDRRLAELAEREIAAAGPGEVKLSDEYASASKTQGIFGAIAGILVIAAIFLMVTKPGL